MSEKLSAIPSVEINNDYIIDQVSFRIPCENFRIRAIITKDAQIPLATEFALRFINIIGQTNINDFATFLGFASSEIRVLITDLIRSGFVQDQGEVIELTKEGKTLFNEGSQKLNLIQYDEFNETVGFDLIAFCLAERLRGKPPIYFKALEELPISNLKKASEAYKKIHEEIFEKHFHEYCQQQKYRKYDENFQLHNIIEVEPKSRFSSELTIPVKLLLEGTPRVESNFSMLLEKGRLQSRSPLVAAVNKRIASIRLPDDTQAALEFVATFDKGLLTYPSIEDFDPIRWAQKTILGRTLKSDYAPSILLIGSSSAPKVREVISEWTQNLDFPVRDQDAPLIWLRPSVSHWGRNAEFFELLSELSSRYNEKKGMILITTSDDPKRDSKDLKKWFSSTEKEESGLFKTGICLKNSISSDAIPSALEIVLDPGRWVLVLVYCPVIMPQTATYFPVAVGFCTANSQIIQSAHESLKNAIYPELENAFIMWGATDESNNSILEIINSAFIYEKTAPQINEKIEEIIDINLKEDELEKGKESEYSDIKNTKINSTCAEEFLDKTVELTTSHQLIIKIFLDKISKNFNIKTSGFERNFINVIRTRIIRGFNYLKDREYQYNPDFIYSNYEDNFCEVGGKIYAVFCMLLADKLGFISEYGFSSVELFIKNSTNKDIFIKYWNKYDLGDLITGPGSNKNLNLYNEAIRKLFGAFYYSYGFDECMRIFDKNFNPTSEKIDIFSLLITKDAKTTLQEITQSFDKKSTLPTYFDHKNTSEMAHDTWYKCKVSVFKKESSGEGKTQKEAELDAAENMINILSTLQEYSRFIKDHKKRMMQKAKNTLIIPLKPAKFLDPEKQVKVKLAFKNILGVDINPELGWVSLFDPETRRTYNQKYDNRTLAWAGAKLYDLIFAINIKEEKSVERGIFITSNISQLFMVDQLRASLGIVSANSNEGNIKREKIEIVQSIIAALFYSDESDFEIVNKFLSKKICELMDSYIKPEGNQYDILKNLAKMPFTCSIIYTQRLQEYTQSINKEVPVYQDLQMEETSINPVFIVSVSWDKYLTNGSSSSKKEARNIAAYEMIKKIYGSQI